MPIWLKDFERAFDELFDDMLISRWGAASRGVTDRGDRYEIRLAASGIDPAELEIEVEGNQLRIGHRRGLVSGTYRFVAAIDAEGTKARWEEGYLFIVAPKRGRRQVPVEKA
jgi:HSP20 family molecular chaperone IbpA